MVPVMPLFLLLLVGGATQATPPPTIETLRARAQERMRQDSAIYSAEEVRRLEDLYQSANRNLRDPGAKEILQRIVREFPKSNRAGSAILYLAQISSGDERERLLKSAIDTYGDTWYGDGVQVGAFARAQLAVFYSTHGKMEQGHALAREVADQFPGAVDHTGRLLVEMLVKLKLL